MHTSPEPITTTTQGNQHCLSTGCCMSSYCSLPPALIPVKQCEENTRAASWLFLALFPMWCRLTLPNLSWCGRNCSVYFHLYEKKKKKQGRRKGIFLLAFYNQIMYEITVKRSLMFTWTRRQNNKSLFLPRYHTKDSHTTRLKELNWGISSYYC